MPRSFYSIPVADGRSVIHAGELVPKDKALALMMAEFAPFGYTAETIERFLDRAFRATQEFLSRLAWAPADQQVTELAQALERDAAMAVQWRSKPPGEREAHAKRCRDGEEVARAEQNRIWQEGVERHKRMLYEADKAERAERAKWTAEYLQKQTKAESAEAKKDAFEEWKRQNETGGRDACAAERALRRQRDDLKAYQSILAKIDKHWGEFAQWVPPLARGATRNVMLNRLSDHEYIEWMFDCASHGLKVYA